MDTKSQNQAVFSADASSASKFVPAARQRVCDTKAVAAAVPSPLHGASHPNLGPSVATKDGRAAQQGPRKRRPSSLRDRSRTLREEDWEPFKPLIINMHVVQNLPLVKVQEHMKSEHDFNATIRQYRSRITKWNLDKNVKTEEMRFIALKQEEWRLREPNKRDLVFQVRGKTIPQGKIDRWKTRHRVGTDASCVRETVGATPPGVSYETASDCASPKLAPDSPVQIPSADTPMGNPEGFIQDVASQDADVHLDIPAVFAHPAGPNNASLIAACMTAPEPEGQGAAANLVAHWDGYTGAKPDGLMEYTIGRFLFESPFPIIQQCSDFEVPRLPLVPEDIRTFPGSPELPHHEWDGSTALSEDKSSKVFDLINSAPFNFMPEYDPFTDCAQRPFLAGDRRNQGHPLSCSMMQRYLLSYWQDFSDQMPILHRPTFHPDRAPSLLLATMMAIGAASLHTVHSDRAKTVGMDLPNYLAWAVRLEALRDKNFRAPASLWALQTLILIEIYGMLCSTSEYMREEAFIGHASTIHLIGRGCSLVGTGDDDGMWRYWVPVEAMRRLVFATFVIDSIHSTIFGTSRIMAYHKVRIPLPCDDDLWTATVDYETRRSIVPTGTRPVLFLEALHLTLNGQSVRTTPFGRTAILAGLLDLSFHMIHHSLLVRSLGPIENSLDGDGQRPAAMATAFDSWRVDFDRSWIYFPGESSSSRPLASAAGRATRYHLASLSNRNVLYHLAHMSIHVDFADCQILAGGQCRPSFLQKIRVVWARSTGSQEAAFHALQLLRSVLVPHGEQYELLRDSGRQQQQQQQQQYYSAKTDNLLYRPWVLYLAALVVWSYGYVVEGPPCRVEQQHQQQQKPEGERGRVETMITYLNRYCRAASPAALAAMTGLNENTALLEVLRETFSMTSWEYLRKSSVLLGNCIRYNAGEAPGS